MKPLFDTVKEISREGGKDAAKGGHGPGVMAKFSENDVSIEKYVTWLESQPADMLQKTYYLLMTGWLDRRQGLADVTSLFRDAIRIVSSGGRVEKEPATAPEPVQEEKATKKKKRCCESREIVKMKNGGKRCKNCGKKWKAKA